MSEAAAIETSQSTIDAKLSEMGIILPESVKPPAKYVPFNISGNIVFISGQLPLLDGEMKVAGTVGDDVSLEQGQETAKNCGLNILAHLKLACDGNLDRVKKVLKLEILVNSAPGFTDQHQVANGVSNFIVDLFGEEVGSHSRVAYGVAGLPMGASVEVAGTFEIE
jgi:enamine deaminase RidA (YjgF/YER057c/UK114 family)